MNEEQNNTELQNTEQTNEELNNEEQINTAEQESTEIENVGMDQETKDFCIDKLQEIIVITDILGYESRISELPNGFPTVLIGVEKNYRDGDTIATCTFLPLEIRGMPYLILQYNIVLNVQVPEDKLVQVDEFIKMMNERFMVGSLMNFDGEISIKYAVYTNPEAKVDHLFVARTLELLILQADEALKKIDKLIEGTLSLDQLSEKDILIR